jgi:anti-sigma factor RsiW
MKDHRFIELLNLYIDRQITAEETAELEAEIQSSPKRQAVYRQYCQIHAATKVVYESFRAGAAEPAANTTGRPATVELFETRRRTNWVHYVGGFAAAAAVAGLFFVRYSANTSLETPVALAPVQTVAVAPVQPAPAKEAVSAPTAAPAVPAATNLISLRNTSTTPDYSAMLVALREQDEERALAERWQSARAQSLFDVNLFDTKHTLPAAEPDQRLLRRQTAGQQVEMTIFQFQR